MERKVAAEPASESAKALLAEAKRYKEQGADKPFLDVWFADARNGYVVGAYNLVFRTADGGKTWEPWFDRTDNPKFFNLYSIRPVAGDLYIAGEGGLVLKLDAAAQRFKALAVPYKGSFFGIAAAGNAVLAFGLRGNVWRSDNGGAAWTKVEAGLPAAIVGAASAASGDDPAGRRRRAVSPRAATADAPLLRSRSSRRCRSPASPTSVTGDSCWRAHAGSPCPNRRPADVETRTRTHHGHRHYRSRRDAGRPRPRGIRPALGQRARAAGLQQPAGDGRRLRDRHGRAGLLRGDEARAERELREDDSAEPAVHQELPHVPEGPARTRQRRPRRRRERRRGHLRPRLPRSAEADQRRARADPGRRPGMGEIALDAIGALDRSHRGGLSRRPGDAGLVQRLGGGRRAAEAEHRPLGDRRQPRRQQLQVEHDLRAAARQGAGHRQAHRLPRALAGAGGEDPRQVRAREEPRPDGEEQGIAEGPHPRDRLRQTDRRVDRRAPQGDDVLRHRRAHRHRNHLRVHALRAQHGAGRRLLDRRGDLAARSGRAPRLRARSLLDPGAVPRVRDRGVARRPEDERHHAGHRTRHAPARGRALYVPPPVPRRPDGAARGRGRLRRPHGHRHSGDQGARADRERRCRRADLHEPAPAARAVVLHRRERGGRGAQPARGAGGDGRQGSGRPLELSRPLHDARAGRWARSVCPPRSRSRDSW